MWWVMVLDLFGLRVRRCGCSRFVLVFLGSWSIYVFDDGVVFLGSWSIYVFDDGVYFPSLLE